MTIVSMWALHVGIENLEYAFHCWFIERKENYRVMTIPAKSTVNVPILPNAKSGKKWYCTNRNASSD